VRVDERRWIKTGIEYAARCLCRLAGRLDRSMAIEARSFLCVSPDAVLTRCVQVIVDFSWGFTITGAEIGLTRPAALSPQAWDRHLDLLRIRYPGSTFDGGYLGA
jgi:hypothetical protein